MPYTEITNLISNIGFPIAITLYLLIKGDKVVSANTKAVNELVTYLKYKK